MGEQKKMRLVIQRVRSASVEVENKVVGQIGNGVLVLVGICQTDTKEHMEFCARRLLRMKLFPKNAQNLTCEQWGEPGAVQWAQSATESGFGILIVSQFTLHAKFKKPKPDFHMSMAPDAAKAMYESFVEEIRKGHCPPPPPSKNKGGKKNNKNIDCAITSTSVEDEIMNSTSSARSKTLDEGPRGPQSVDHDAPTSQQEQAQGGAPGARPESKEAENLVHQAGEAANNDKKEGGNNNIKSVSVVIPKNALATGEFGAMMNVKLENDGPVTMIVDSDLEMGAQTGPTPTATAKEKNTSSVPEVSKIKEGTAGDASKAA